MLDSRYVRNLQSPTEDPRIVANRALIARIQSQMEDDGMTKRKPNKKKTAAIPVETCTCRVEIRNGEKWKVLNLECFDHGLFSNRVRPEQARSYDLSKHPFAE